MKYKLYLTEKQCNIIQQALEVYSRLHMGQLSIVATEMFMLKKNFLEIRESFEDLEPLVTGLKRNAFHGIHSKDISDDARVAWDVQQVVRHQVSHDRADIENIPKDFMSRMTVNYDTPMQTSVSEALPKIEKVKE